LNDCLFCRIVAGEIPSQKVYEDAEILAFRDIHPAAPVHVLFIPKKHLAHLGEVGPEDEALLGKMLLVIAQEAPKLGLAGGYRVVNNCGEEAGMSVGHLHLHLIGGRPLNWPPG